MQCNQKQKKNKNMKTVVLAILLFGALNASAQVKKDTVLLGDSISYPKLQEGKKYFSLYKGKKVRATKGDKGKRAFVIYNVYPCGERKISKIYYAN